MNLPLFLARRIYESKADKNAVSRPAVRIATMGVAIGLAVMLVSVSVVLGFKHSVRDKVAGFGSHIQVASFSTLQTGDVSPIAMGDSMLQVLKAIDGVEHVQRYAMREGILKTDSDFLGVVFKGVAEEYDTLFLHHHLTEGTIPHFSSEKSTSKILLSQSMADKLKVHSGASIYAYFIDDSGVRARKLTITGIYQTHLSQYDDITCFIDLYTVQRLNRWQADQATGAEIAVNDFGKNEVVASRIVNEVNRTTDRYGETYSSQTIQELNPQIFHWLDLLDMNVWIILALMIAVAGITMISGLLILILERTQMIGTLKALGSRNRPIRKTFLWLAAMIIGRGLVIGNVIGLGLILLQRLTHVVKLDPTVYYVKAVPVEFNIPLFLLINIATLLICVFVLIAPSYLVARIQPAKSMRYE